MEIITKEQFMIQFILNRALAVTDAHLNGNATAKEADKAWIFIQDNKSHKHKEADENE